MPRHGVYVEGSEVEQRRKALFLTQEELAHRLGIHHNTLLRIESDPTYRTGFSTLKKLARRFKCDPNDLVRNEQEVSA